MSKQGRKTNVNFKKTFTPFVKEIDKFAIKGQRIKEPAKVRNIVWNILPLKLTFDVIHSLLPSWKLAKF